MGVWGVGNFDNDDAGNWINEFKKKPSTESIKRTLMRVAQHGGDYLQATSCCRALAAAEAVAALHGRPNPKMPPALEETLRAVALQPDEDLIPSAQEAVAQIIADSEVKEMWEEDEDDSGAWYAEIDGLRGRLEG